ncbi:hypothetical protein KUTeg_017470 [Tegillarca granosa]|uniref:Uncharacterized protein n=1 Tax=Tegillarca granosa TaxID=220873 RepID=A0ABQ9EIW9_TEGGR|nr:hypothetical protein KUTeg_017470 [Tegillarca granosa]
MEKASRALRRSSAKLLSLGGGNSDLNVMISEVKDMRNHSKAFMNSQHTASQDFSRWAAGEENRAIQDVINQMSELNLSWTEVQREFSEHLKEYRQMLEMVLEGEKNVIQAKNNLAACDQRASKLKKELKKSAKKATVEEMRVLENKLSQAERSKDLAQLEVSDRIRENEATKMIRLKEGLVRISDAYIEMGKNCSTLFQAQREIALEIPDVHGQDLEEIKYTGSGTTQLYVQQARERVKQYKCQSFRFSFPVSQTSHPGML